MINLQDLMNEYKEEGLAIDLAATRVCKMLKPLGYSLAVVNEANQIVHIFK